LCIHGSRDRDDVHIASPAFLGAIREAHRGGFKLLLADFSRSVLALAQLSYAPAITIQANDFEFAGQGDGQGQSDVAEPDDNDTFVRHTFFS